MISLELNYPPTTNTYYRNVGGQMKISANGRAYRQHVQSAVREQLGPVEPMAGDIAIAVLMNPPDRRRRDLDNVAGKALFDALTKAGVWRDDSQVKRIVAEMGMVVEGGRCEIQVSQMALLG